MSNCRMLDGKVSLITGGSRGIGRAIVERFAEEGATIYVNSRKPNSLDEYCAELAESHETEVIPLYYDVTDIQGMKNAFMRISKERSRLDILVNNAGIMKDAILGMIRHEDIEEIFRTNVFAVIEHIQYAARLMKRYKSGCIVNISSIIGTMGNPGQVAYSASKGAVISLTKSAAKELASDGIRVNAIAPGMVDTDMYRSVGDALRDEHLRTIKLGRLGEARDISDAIVFLSSGMAGYITGQILTVDGCTII